jgi:ABC-type taurine transport system substrate-binding protein
MIGKGHSAIGMFWVLEDVMTARAVVDRKTRSLERPQDVFGLESGEP